MLIDFPSTVNPLVPKKFAGANIKKLLVGRKSNSAGGNIKKLPPGVFFANR